MRKLLAALVGSSLLLAFGTPAGATSGYVYQGYSSTFEWQVAEDSDLERVYPSEFDIVSIEVRWPKTSKEYITFRYVTSGLIDYTTYMLNSSAVIYLDVDLDGIEDFWIPIEDDIWNSLPLKGASKTAVYSSRLSEGYPAQCDVTQQLSRTTFKYVDVKVPMSCLGFTTQVGMRVLSSYGYGTGGVDSMPNYTSGLQEFTVFDTPLSPTRTTYLANAINIDIELPKKAVTSAYSDLAIRVTNLAGQPLQGVHLELESNGSISPITAVTNADGVFTGTILPLFDSNVFVTASYGTNSVTARMTTVNYRIESEAMQFEDTESLCWVTVTDRSLMDELGVTGVRWKVERDKSGTWDEWKFDTPIPDPDAPTNIDKQTSYGSYGNVQIAGGQTIFFKPNAVKAGETIKCSVAVMMGKTQNFFETSEFTATRDGPNVTPPEPKLIANQRTLASFSETSTTLTSMQKSQVKAAVEANPNATKFICTGIRYAAQPMSENIKVRKRAKAACDYAKTLNPELSTWYQNKPTDARSYSGKVLLTIKSPAD